MDSDHGWISLHVKRGRNGIDGGDEEICSDLRSLGGDDLDRTGPTSIHPKGDPRVQLAARIMHPPEGG